MTQAAAMFSFIGTESFLTHSLNIYCLKVDDQRQLRTYQTPTIWINNIPEIHLTDH